MGKRTVPLAQSCNVPEYSGAYDSNKGPSQAEVKILRMLEMTAKDFDPSNTFNKQNNGKRKEQTLGQ